jgi:acetyltransferase
MSTGKYSSELKVAFRRHPLDAIFKPRNVAVIGATEKEDSVGRTLLWNLIRNPFGGTVFPVNPKRSNILGIRAYPSIREVPDQVDLAVIVTPAPTVPGVIAECVEAGVKGAIIISAGFKETGEAGAKLEQQILEQARDAQMRIIGPNCLGVMSPLTGINATFAKGMAGRAASASSARAARSAPRCSTGACRKTSASAPSSPSARCSMWTGRTCSTTWAMTSARKPS